MVKLRNPFARKPKLIWQTLKSSGRVPNCQRTAVPGGWLVAMEEGQALTFVPDPDHLWDGNTLNERDCL